MAKNEKVTVYTYGQKHTFPTLAKAKAEVEVWMAGSEGAERDRYTDVYLMLCEGRTVAWDCNGIPPPKPKLKPLTDAERAKWAKMRKENKERGERLDQLRAELEAKKEELLKPLKPLMDEIAALAEKWNSEAIAMIAYERRERA